MSTPHAEKPAASRLRAWVSAEMFFIVGVVVAIFFAILAPDISRELDLGESQLGTLSGAFFVTYSVGQLALGTMLDRYAPRLVLGAMAILSAIGCVLFAMSTSLPIALVARVMLGVGLSVSFVGVMYVIGRDYPERFSFMASLSQSLANLTGAAVALAASFTAALTTFREPFMAVGAIFVAIAIALTAFTGNRSPGASPRGNATAPIGTVLAACFGSLQFWMGLIYYSCLFGTILAYSDLWDIQFQMSYFDHSSQQSALFNAAILFGVTVGSLVAGAWAQMRGDFVLPARAFGLLAVLVFALMSVLVLDAPWAIAANFCIGFALAGSILGLTAVQQHLPEFAQATGTAITATAAFVMGGAIQPLVGVLVEAPIRSGALFSRILLDAPGLGAHIVRNPDFATYQKGIALLLASVTIGFAASLLFRRVGAASTPEST